MSLEVGKMCGKRHRKSAENTFPRLGRLKNSDNRLSQTWENQKNGRKWPSQPWENKKSAKIDFPPRGKVKKC
ncbi:hypothetical protein HMPREF2992_07270 [Prevotella sp. HMSC069G02]|nr:hypothetical protein HMPREF2992_07270 [Prevotella sp. HMSC069G02]